MRDGAPRVLLAQAAQGGVSKMADVATDLKQRFDWPNLAGQGPARVVHQLTARHFPDRFFALVSCANGIRRPAAVGKVAASAGVGD